MLPAPQMRAPLPAGQHRKVCILYFEGCPNHRPTADLVRGLIKDLGLRAEVEEVELRTPEDAARLRFLGSPTVQVNDVDIEPEARSRTDYAMSCRLYKTPNGLPSGDMLLAALGAPAKASRAEPTERSETKGGACCCDSGKASLRRAPMRKSPNIPGGLIATGGSVVSAMLSSACCWVPLLLVAFGASAAGVSNLLDPGRPYFIAAAVTMLALSFYLTYIRRPAAECCSGEGSPPRRKFGRATSWVSAVIVAAFIFFPQYVGLGLAASSSAASAGAPAAQLPLLDVKLRVEGMHCEACATALTASLAKVPGVMRAKVNYATKSAQMLLNNERAIRSVLDATRDAGFSASLDAGSHTP